MKPRALEAEQVKMCNIVPDRPGIIRPFMQPVALKNQVRAGAKKTEIKFVPGGKTLVGGVQWVAEPQRPGIAEPLIVAKKELKDLEKGLAVEARLATAQAKAVAKHEAAKAAAQVAKAQAASVEAEKSVAEMQAMANGKVVANGNGKAAPTANGGMSGYGYRW